MSSAMTVDDFITGVVSAMRLTDLDNFPEEAIEVQFVKAFNLVERLSLEKGLELRFHCKLNPVTKESPSIHYALIRASQSGLIARDGHSWKILISKAEATEKLERSPLSVADWRQVSMKMQPQTFASLLSWFD